LGETETKAPPQEKLPDAKTCHELLSRMALIRRFEEEAGRQYQRAKAGGFLHLAIGEEATIVGTTSVMEDDDYLIGTYRTHGHAIARGTDPKNVMAELFGRVDGTSGGRGGSMHIFDRERRFMGGYGIVGGNLPLAAGLGLASSYREEGAVTVCMFGDGASNTGNFGETMNLAALWKLPIVFLVENNLYGMGTSVERHSAQTDLSKKAEGFGIPGERIDGMDVLAVREGVSEHIRIAREEGRPTLVEAFTYRYHGHSAADPEVYREKSEVQEWREKDPVETFARRCIEADVLGEKEVDEIRSSADEQVREAVKFADASPEPALDSLYENLYVVSETMGWYAIDERSPQPHRGERESEAPAEAKELAEAAAAHAGQPAGPRPDPADEGDASEGVEEEAEEESDDEAAANSGDEEDAGGDPEDEDEDGEESEAEDENGGDPKAEDEDGEDSEPDEESEGEPEE
jgi:pyruvate dehydrogenase E1 component alpha subunit